MEKRNTLFLGNPKVEDFYNENVFNDYISKTGETEEERIDTFFYLLMNSKFDKHINYYICDVDSIDREIRRFNTLTDVFEFWLDEVNLGEPDVSVMFEDKTLVFNDSCCDKMIVYRVNEEIFDKMTDEEVLDPNNVWRLKHANPIKLAETNEINIVR